MASTPDETRDGVELTNLDQPLFDGADATKRDLVDYLDAVHTRLLPALVDRPLSVVRVRVGQEPCLQKNVPKYAPEWLKTYTYWAESSQREVHHAQGDGRRSLLWFANQRAVEDPVALSRAPALDRATHLVLCPVPPEGSDSFGAAVQGALLVRQALTDLGLTGIARTSGA